jgi:hypothetical protein
MARQACSEAEDHTYKVHVEPTRREVVVAHAPGLKQRYADVRRCSCLTQGRSADDTQAVRAVELSLHGVSVFVVQFSGQ